MAINTFESITGPMLMGIIASAIIFGISCLQAYLYYNEYCSHDSTILKTWAAIIVILDAVHLSLLIHCLWHYTVSSFGHNAVVNRAIWSLLVALPVGGLIGLLVQLFFAYRLLRLTGNQLILPIILAILGVVQLIFTTTYIVKGFSVQFFDLNGKLSLWSSTAMYASIACDALITLSTTYYLLKSRRGSQRIIAAVNHLLAYTLNTGLLITLFVMVALITFQIFPSTMISAAFIFISTELYCCSFFSILNSRDLIRKQLSGITDNSDPVPHDSIVIATPNPTNHNSIGPSFGNLGRLPDHSICMLTETSSTVRGSSRASTCYPHYREMGESNLLIGTGLGIAI